MSTLGKIVYLSEAQASELFASGSITVDGSTITYSADDLYLTPENIEYVKKSGDTMTGALTAPTINTLSTSFPVYWYMTDENTAAVGYHGVRMSDRRFVIAYRNGAGINQQFSLPPLSDDTSASTWYDILTTKGDYAMTGTLTAAAPITSYHSTTPSFAYKTSASGTPIAESAARAGTRQIFFREYASDTAYHEDYLLPEHTTNATGNAIYNILTTKTPVTVAQGGTNATTVEGARTTLNVYSKSEVDALITGGATPSGEYLPISGGNITGNLTLSSSTVSLCVGSSSTAGGTGVRIFRDGEGGNIALWSPNGTGWQMDAYSNTFFRLYYNAGAPSWLFMNDGSFKIQGTNQPVVKLRSAVADITSSTNNLTSDIYPGVICLDKNEVTTCGFANVVGKDGSNAFYVYIQNRDGSNNPSGLRGIKYTLSNANVGSWVISDPAAFRSALSIGSVTDSNVWLVNTSRTANTVLAAPNGSAGSASFRALVANDIPSLSASKITSGIMTGPITISENLGAGCYVKSTNIDLSSATNGVTSTTQPGFVIQDKTTRNIAYFKGYVESNGNTGYRIGASQFDTSGNQVSQAVIGVSIAKNGTQTWTFPIPFIQAVRSEFTGSSTWPNAYSKAKALIKVVFKITYSNNVHVLVIDVPKQVVTTNGQFFFSSSCVHDGKQLFAQGMYTTDGAQWEAVYLGSDVQTYSSKNYYYI